MFFLGRDLLQDSLHQFIHCLVECWFQLVLLFYILLDDFGVDAWHGKNVAFHSGEEAAKRLAQLCRLASFRCQHTSVQEPVTEMVWPALSVAFSVMTHSSHRKWGKNFLMTSSPMDSLF